MSEPASGESSKASTVKWRGAHHPAARTGSVQAFQTSSADAAIVRENTIGGRSSCAVRASSSRIAAA